MIYIYRILWMNGYVPIALLEFALVLFFILLVSISIPITYVVTGNIEDIPDWMIPGVLSLKIDRWYKALQR